MAKYTAQTEGCPREHYEVEVKTGEASEMLKRDGGAAFNPKPSKDRPRVYKKVNDADY